MSAALSASLAASSTHAVTSGSALSGALSNVGVGAGATDDRMEVAEAVLSGAWRTLRAAGFREAEIQTLFDQIADRPEDLARRLRKMANAAG
jgi:hypothetical protein